MINRHNYEEFFLMYVDGELNPQQRAAVELFVQQNPDLAVEMDLLQQAKLLPEDEIIFDNKETLLKNQQSIGVDNYEEYFLNYIDEELKPEQKHEVEKFVLQHPQFQDPFTLLKQTKLEPENVVFEDKRSLYRREAPRVIPLILKRFAVAAVVAAIAFAVWVVVPKQTGQGEIAAVTPSGNSTNNAKQNDTANIKQPASATTVAQQADIAAAGKANNPAAGERRITKLKADQKTETPVQLNRAEDNTLIASVEDKPKQERPLQSDNTVATGNTAGMLNDNGEKENEQQKDILAYQNTQRPQAESNETTMLKPAVYKELNTDEDANNNTIYVGSLGLNKNKVRGIMKKVGGIFSGKSKSIAEGENGKLQVAGFQLNTN